MSRPETHDDLANYEKTEHWAGFTLQSFTHLPKVVAAYAAFCRAAIAAGATVDKTGNVERRLSTDELDALLGSRQKSWDTNHSRYLAVRAAYNAGFGDMSDLTPKWSDTEAWSLRHFAERNGLPVFDLIAEDDDVRAAARRTVLGS